MSFDINALNEEQKKALFALEGAVLVSAGAGSGKTRLLTHRIAYLISEKHVLPERILAITFTNKAANEMKERVSKMVENGSRVWISTFHSMCVRILRRHISALQGYENNFSIYSDADTDRVLKKIFEDKGIEDKNFRKKVDFHISNLKNSGKHPTVYAQEFQYVKEISDIISIFYAYQAELNKNNALDFDDLLIKAHELFSENPEILQLYSERFQYVLVDEFQDTNSIQYQLVKMLSNTHGNVFVVGDEDQSIYSWRGAEFENIFRFRKDFSPCQTFKLEQNYRSTKTIIEHANKVISNNKQRLSKHLFTNNSEGEKVVYKNCYDEQEEATFVAQCIHKLLTNGTSFSEIAVLVRINALTLPFEQAFLSYNIPHRIFGGFKFFERVEVKNLVSFLRMMVNPKDEGSLLRIINFPKRGIGDAAISKVREAGAEKGYNLFESIVNISLLNLPQSVIAKFLSFSNAVNELTLLMPTLGIEDFVIECVKKFAVKQAYASKSEEDINRVLNIDSFIVAASEFAEDNTDATIIDFLENISLISDLDSIGEENNAVTIATIHAAKGLEYKHVFVVGLEENIFPISRAKNSDFELEEERRLMYVAVTRAKEGLVLTGSKTRYIYGKRDYMVQSRFVTEMGLGDSSSKWDNAQRRAEQSFNSTNQDTNYAYKPITSSLFAKPIFEKPNQPIVNQCELSVGMVVEHPRFGLGEVESMSGDNVDIVFEGFGKKTLVKHLAPLSIPKEDA